MSDFQLSLLCLLVTLGLSYQRYMGETHWLLWLLGPATIAFAVPVYDNLAIIKRHWMSLTAGVTTASVVAVTSSVWLARLFTLPDEIQRSLAVRSVTTPFALAAAKPLGGIRDGGRRCTVSAAFYSRRYSKRGRIGGGIARRRYRTIL